MKRESNTTFLDRLHAFRTGRTHRGFTLLELMIVMTIILILATMGAGRYEQSVQRAKEAALKQDLFVMRQAIEQYTLDKTTAPQSLDDLVTAGYLREIPTDPMTRALESLTSIRPRKPTLLPKALPTTRGSSGSLTHVCALTAGPGDIFDGWFAAVRCLTTPHVSLIISSRGGAVW
jgi:prepilin-type N-terminal cleavage/methylation domain-containing protein